MRDRIIRQSIESLRREGLRFSVDTLAERLNISKKTIYKYFPNKEALALAMYQRYYADAMETAAQLARDSSGSAHSKLLALYFDAKAMTCSAVFNKYKLNEALYSYTAGQNDALWEIILSTLGETSARDKAALRVIVDGTFEKLCDEKTAPEDVIERLAKVLW